MELEIEVFDDVMHVSRNRSFSLKKSLKKGAASCYTILDTYIQFFSSLATIAPPYSIYSTYILFILRGCDVFSI